MKRDFVNFVYMIKIQKAYLLLLVISISYFVILISLNHISDYHFKLSQQEIKELNMFAENNNITAIKRLANYYFFIEKDHNKTADVYRKYKDINPKVKLALLRFLKLYGYEVAKKGEYGDIVIELEYERENTLMGYSQKAKNANKSKPQ